MYELRKYRENIEAMYQEMGGVKPATPTKALEPLGVRGVAKTKPVGEGRKVEEEESGPGRAQVLSFLPFSPQLVEVIPSMSEGDEGNMAGPVGSPADSAPSSPGSEGDLQIDDSSWSRKDKSPVKLRSEGKGLMGLGRRTQNSLQSVLDTVELGPVSLTPGTPLSVGGASGAAGHGSGAGPRGKKRGLAGVVSILSKKLALSDDTELENEEGNHPLFSRCYDDQGKTAIAEIDPEPKRPVRKVSQSRTPLILTAESVHFRFQRG